MSMHKQPLTPLEREGLTKHGLPIGAPSQLSDSFRLGVRWALEEAARACDEAHGVILSHGRTSNEVCAVAVRALIPS